MKSFHVPKIFKNKHKTTVEIVLKKKIECLVLIGDSLLDNFYWIEEHKKDIEYQIVATLKKTYNENNKINDDNKSSKQKSNNSIIRIHNLSLDEMDVDGILVGIEPNPLYVKARKTFKLASYPLDKDNKLYPIKILSSMCMNKEIKIIQKLKDKNHINPTVILSVGSTDLHRNLKYGRPELIIEALRDEHFAQQYEKIVHQIVHNLGLNLIIILGSEPHESFTEKQLHFSRDDLLSCMEFTATKIFQIAEKYKCPIVDLSRTLNPFDRTHYGKTEIELSCKSGQFLVDLIIKILATWDWIDDKKKSKIYYGIKNDNHGIQTVLNNKQHRQCYFNILQQRASTLNKNLINAQEDDLLADLFSDQKNDNE